MDLEFKETLTRMHHLDDHSSSNSVVCREEVFPIGRDESQSSGPGFQAEYLWQTIPLLIA